MSNDFRKYIGLIESTLSENGSDRPLIENDEHNLVGQPEVTSTSYSVDIEEHAFVKMIKYEDVFNDSLDVILQQTPASDIEYNGNYGSAVFFTLSADDDTPETKAEIRQIIVEYIEKIVSWRYPTKGDAFVALDGQTIKIGTVPDQQYEASEGRFRIHDANRIWRIVVADEQGKWHEVEEE